MIIALGWPLWRSPTALGDRGRSGSGVCRRLCSRFASAVVFDGDSPFYVVAVRGDSQRAEQRKTNARAKPRVESPTSSCGLPPARSQRAPLPLATERAHFIMSHDAVAKTNRRHQSRPPPSEKLMKRGRDRERKFIATREETWPLSSLECAAVVVVVLWTEFRGKEGRRRMLKEEAGNWGQWRNQLMLMQEPPRMRTKN